MDRYLNEISHGANIKPGPPQSAPSASALIIRRIQELGDWRGETLAQIRRLFLSKDPAIVEDGNGAGFRSGRRTGSSAPARPINSETYKQVVKLTFARGAALLDPEKMFNGSLDGNGRRAIDIRDGQPVDQTALKALILAAIAANQAARRKK